VPAVALAHAQMLRDLSPRAGSRVLDNASSRSQHVRIIPIA